eukprot:6187451-Amphidinium_carterae.5
MGVLLGCHYRWLTTFLAYAREPLQEGQNFQVAVIVGNAAHLGSVAKFRTDLLTCTQPACSMPQGLVSHAQGHPSWPTRPDQVWLHSGSAAEFQLVSEEVELEEASASTEGSDMQ